MGSFFSPKMPMPAPVPETPKPDNSEAQAAQERALRDRARGRALTAGAGDEMAAEDQFQRGMLKKAQRQSFAARDVLG